MRNPGSSSDSIPQWSWEGAEGRVWTTPTQVRARGAWEGAEEESSYPGTSELEVPSHRGAPKTRGLYEAAGMVVRQFCGTDYYSRP